MFSRIVAHRRASFPLDTARIRWAPKGFGRNRSGAVFEEELDGGLGLEGMKRLETGVKSGIWSLLLGNHDFQPAHIGAQRLGNDHRAVGLKVVFQEGDEHAGGGHHGVVQGVGQVGTALSLDPHL